jgi:hypothetical protein
VVSFLNGLAAAGAGLADFAGKAGLEVQRSDLAMQQLTLANTLATQRDLTVEGVRHGHTMEQQESQNTFTGGQKALDRTSDLNRTLITEGGANTRNERTIAGQLQIEQLKLNAPSPEIKTAIEYGNLTPAQQRSFIEHQAAKAGLPLWMLGSGTDVPMPPPGAAISVPDSTGGTTGGGTGSGGGTSRAPSGAPTDAGTGGWDQSSSDGTGTPSTTAGTAGGAAPKTGSVTGAPVTAPFIDRTQTAYNDRALAGLPDQVASQVRAMVEGRAAPPSSFAASKPYWQALIGKAHEYDPTFDQTTWAGRVATRKAFVSGPEAKNVTAINTALGHAGVVADSLADLSNGSIKPWNAAINWMHDMTGDKGPVNAKMAVDALASEARKVFAGSSGGNLAELREWQENFPINGSQSQQTAALRQFVSLLDSRLGSLADQYNRGMGRADDPMHLLEPHAREVYERLLGSAPLNATGYQLGKPPAGGGAPSPAAATGATPAPADRNAPMSTQQMYGGTAPTPAPARPAPTTPPAVLPMPRSAAEAVPGKIYDTARGPARWDGSQFIPVQ